jgi:NAD(P)-dependent dehydrogenase (short-subunit alcohol dehydrogenase family)
MSVDLRATVDDCLELTVVGSFSGPGFHLRRLLFGWASPPDGVLAGKTVLITGPTSGLGLATTEAMATLGARVVLAGRSAERLGAMREALITQHGEDRFPVVVADMGSLASVRAAVERVLATEPRLDVLIDNAGAIFADRAVGPDGLERTFAILAAAPFVLLAGLLPLLRRTGGARVICVTSGGMYTQALPLDDLQYTRGEYAGPKAYARAKRAQVALVREWARRLARSGADVTVNAMHPGWADTPGLAEQLPAFHRVMGRFLRTPAEGIDTITWLATDPAAGIPGGRLYLDRRKRPFDRVLGTRLSAAERRSLWDAVVTLTGVSDPLP